MGEVASEQQQPQLQLQQSRYPQPTILGLRRKENLQQRSKGRGSIAKTKSQTARVRQEEKQK
jgi:hypothetical protein